MNTQTKHTPGPLSVVSNFDDDFFGEVLVVDINGDLMCRMPDNWSIWNSEKKYEAAKHERVIAEANAKLIAAAPELLEALQLLYDLNNNSQPPGNDDLDKAFAAIKKATQ